MRILLPLMTITLLLTASACAARKKGFGADEPRAVKPAMPFVALAASPEGTCGIRQDATLWCWGHNARQGLGLGADTRVLHPQQVGPLLGVVAVAPGADHTCALRADKTLFCVGRNARGQLGNGKDQDSDLFVGVDGAWTSVAVGPAATCGVKADGSLWCWGAGEAPKSRAISLLPTRVDAATDWVAVDSTAVGRKADGTAATFGKLPKSSTDLRCAVHADGTLWCWGGDLIVGPNDDQVYTEAAPYKMSLDADWTSVTLGSEHACALKRNGRAYCWGANSYGQLGIDKGPGEISYQRWPAPVMMP